MIDPRDARMMAATVIAIYRAVGKDLSHEAHRALNRWVNSEDAHGEEYGNQDIVEVAVRVLSAGEYLHS